MSCARNALRSSSVFSRTCAGATRSGKRCCGCRKPLPRTQQVNHRTLLQPLSPPLPQPLPPSTPVHPPALDIPPDRGTVSPVHPLFRLFLPLTISRYRDIFSIKKNQQYDAGETPVCRAFTVKSAAGRKCFYAGIVTLLRNHYPYVLHSGRTQPTAYPRHLW